MAVTEVATQSATQSSATSVTVTKPTGTASGDLLLAFFTSNSQNCTPPSGFTEISDEAVEVFRNQVFYKVAGGSEPANYSFTVGSNAPLVCTIVALRGIDSDDPIDIDPVVDTDSGNHSEAYTTPTVSGGLGGSLIYWRCARRDTTTPLTFTGAAATELEDEGIAGSTVSYSHAIYLANTPYTSAASKSGLAITCSATETHNIVGTVGIKAVILPMTMDVQLPLISADFAGNPAIPGEVDIGLPKLEFDGEGFYGDTEGSLDVEVPISMEVDGGSPPAGALDAVIEFTFTLGGETRKFNENVVTPDRDERWIIVTPEGYKLGARRIRYMPLRIELPLLDADFIGRVPPFGFPPDPIPVTAHDATTKNGVNKPVAGTVTASVTANNATVSTILAEFADATATTGVTVTANNATVRTGRAALAGHATVTCHN